MESVSYKLRLQGADAVGGVRGQGPIDAGGQVPRAGHHFALAPGREDREALTKGSYDAVIGAYGDGAACRSPQGSGNGKYPLQNPEIRAGEIPLRRRTSHYIG